MQYTRQQFVDTMTFHFKDLQIEQISEFEKIFLFVESFVSELNFNAFRASCVSWTRIWTSFELKTNQFGNAMKNNSINFIISLFL